MIRQAALHGKKTDIYISISLMNAIFDLNVSKAVNTNHSETNLSDVENMIEMRRDSGLFQSLYMVTC